ncbi:MAG: hypothetical protein V3S51_05300 [Dehalococcoidia bacterium]
MFTRYADEAYPLHYDSLPAKLLSWGTNRGEAISTMKRAVREYHIEGIKTNIPLHIVSLDNEPFKEGDYAMHFIEEQGILKKLCELKKAGVFS